MDEATKTDRKLIAAGAARVAADVTAAGGKPDAITDLDLGERVIELLGAFDFVMSAARGPLRVSPAGVRLAARVWDIVRDHLPCQAA